MERIHNSKYRFIPGLPKLYWFFYRHPLNLFGLIFGLVPGTIGVVMHIFIGYIIDGFSTPNASAIITKYSIYLFLYAAMNSLASMLSMIFWIRTSSSIRVKSQKLLFKHFVQSDVSFFDTHSIGQLLNLLGDDSNKISRVFSTIKVHQLRGIGQVVTTFITITSADWRMGIIQVFGLGVVAFISQQLRGAASKYNRPRALASGKMLTVASEMITNYHIISAYNSQQYAIEKFSQAADNNFYLTSQNMFYNQMANPLIEFVARIMMNIYLNISPYSVLNGTATAGTVLATIRAIYISSFGLNNSLGFSDEENRGRDSAERVFEYIETQVSYDLESGIELENFSGKIEFKDVSFQYPTRNNKVLENVSFIIEAGYISALVGASGSGKSTVAQLLMRFYDVDSGEILFDDVNIKRLNPRWIHRILGYVQQDPSLFEMSVKNNILFSKIEATDEEIKAATLVSHSFDFIMQLPDQFEENIGEGGSKLSGGQRQRIAIARAILKNPVFLIIDEATSALDSENEKLIQDALNSVMENRTSLVIAHRLNTIRHAHKIFVFQKGSLIETGTHEELYSLGGTYFHLVQRQLYSGVPISMSLDFEHPSM